MSAFLASTAALAYATGVVTVHRLNVFRLRKQAGFYPTLAWLDWDALLAGVFAAGTGPRTFEAPERALDGGPFPSLLETAPDERARPVHALLCEVVRGGVPSSEQINAVGLSGGEARWVETLVMARARPLVLLERLREVNPSSLAEVLLREHLALTHEVTPLNLELAVFSAKRRIAQAMGRFSASPALFFARAKASSLLGLNGSVLDDLARAVYFSRHANFYLRAVLETPFVEEARPALWAACLQSARGSHLAAES